MLNHNRHSISFPYRCTSLAFRWLAVGLLLFAQIAFATHYHEVDEVNAHDYDCAVCLQLHGVKNTAGPSTPAALPVHIPVLSDNGGVAASLPLFNLYLPPSRAPPLH